MHINVLPVLDMQLIKSDSCICVVILIISKWLITHHIWQNTNEHNHNNNKQRAQHRVAVHTHCARQPAPTQPKSGVKIHVSELG